MAKMHFKLFLMLLLAPVVALAQQPLTSEALWSLSLINSPKLHSDGKRIIYGVRVTDMKENRSRNTVYIQNIAGGDATELVAASVNAGQAQWTPDGSRISFVSSESGSRQLYEINPDGTNRRQVTDVPGGIDWYVYSPAMNYIAYGQEVQIDKTVRELYPDLDKVQARIYDALNHRHWDSWHDGKYNHVFVLPYANGKTTGKAKDIMEGQPYDAPMKPFGGAGDIAFSPDGRSLVYTSKKATGTEYAYSTNSDLYLYDLGTGKETNLTESNKGYDTDPVFSPDGRFLAWLSMERPGYEADKNRLMLRNMATGEVKEATAGFDQSAGHLEWSADGQRIYFTSATQATKQIFKYNLAPSKGQPAIEKLTNGWHDYISLTVGRDGKNDVVVGGKTTFNNPQELYVVDASKKTERQLTDVNKQKLAQIKYGKIEQRKIKSTDGKEVLTWVVFPPDFDSTKKYPAIVYCQGGPQSVVSQFFSTRWNFPLMAAQGYIVIAPNRRGLPSFGQEWNDAIIGDYGGQPMKDILAVTDVMAQESYIDETRMGAVGASFGGYTVYWLAGNHEGRFKTFISHCGMFNMESWYGSTEEMFFAQNDQQGPYWANSRPFEQFSPHRFVKNWNTPMLVIHNEKDFRVPLAQGLEAFTAAQSKGVKSRFLYFPDENHWVLKPQNSVLWQRVFIDWLNQTL